MITFRDLCLAKAALHHLSTLDAVPARVADVASNAGQFAASAADGERVADKLDDAVFAERLIGNLRASDAEELIRLAGARIAQQRTERPAFTRQLRFLERVYAFIRERQPTLERVRAGE